MDKIASYEVKIARLEQHLSELQNQKQMEKYQQSGIQKILIHPLELHRLIQAEERKNREILK